MDYTLLLVPVLVIAGVVAWKINTRASSAASVRRDAAKTEAAIANLPLGIIERVEFYKRHLLTIDLVCCDVITNEELPQVWTFHEDMAGWPRLLQHLQHLPGFVRGWQHEVIQPPFAENRFVAFDRRSRSC